MDRFASQWAFKETYSGNAIQCHYGKLVCKSRGTGQRKQIDSLKGDIKYPFRIGYYGLE